MKRIVLGLVLSLVPVLLFSGSPEIDDGLEALIGTIDLSEWDEWIEREGVDVGFLPSQYLREIAGLQFRGDPSGWTDRLGALLLPGVRSALARMTVFLGFAVLTAAVNGLSETSSPAETARTVFRIIGAGAVLVLSAAELRTARVFNTVNDHC